MGRRGLLGLGAALAAALLLGGCGGDDGATLTFSGSDEEQIAATVNAMTAAIAAGEGAVACELMTERGQQIMLRIGRQTGSQVADCAAAVPAAAGLGFDPGDYRITPKDVSAGAEGAEARCDDDGAFILERTEEGWRVNTPWCAH